jgi:hypothetical protein
MSEMDDDHLANCIRLCERNQQTRGRRADPNAPGVYQELVQEQRRRQVRVTEHIQALTEQLNRQEAQRNLSVEQLNRRQDFSVGAGQLNRRDPRDFLVNEAPEEKIGLPKDAPVRRIKK